MSASLLKERTGEDLAAWKDRTSQQSLTDEKSLRSRLAQPGVTGHIYPVTVLFTPLFQSGLWIDHTQYRACGIGYDRAGAIEHRCNRHIRTRHWNRHTH